MNSLLPTLLPAAAEVSSQLMMEVRIEAEEEEVGP